MYKHIGRFTLGNKVDITDPCYDKDVWCRMTVECQPGEYTGIANVIDEGDWGERVAQLFIFKDGIETDDFVKIGEIGVDAGLAGFFNNKQDFSDEEWYELCDKTREGEAWQMYDGIFCQSGYGDGSYDVYANKDGSAFMIEFIYEEDDEDY